ncbi:hypothetical protein AB0F17_16095 [Nonomuraea sp. NPDC026600]|uniref:hypothetical protein n=1 Tax=Nonomuraea sp. NPDC026600 TaxID=3155363 RepID=UPI00340EA45C
MTPEQAAKNAAYILDRADAMNAFPEQSAALVAVADGWTRLHTALAHAPITSEPATVTVHIDPAIAGDVDPETIAESVALAMGLTPKTEPVPVLRTDGETVFEFHGERWCVVASSFRHNDGGASELSLRIIPEGQPDRPDDVAPTFP